MNANGYLMVGFSLLECTMSEANKQVKDLTSASWLKFHS